ncbi:MAG: type 4a pilus biogenesis protein PilO [Gammaproteobacteria bacterium]|jgi:type IV pilus assembly protein PilO
MDWNEIKNFDISSVDFKNIGAAPTPVRAALIVVLFVAILFAGYYFDTRDQITQLDQAQNKEQTLRQTFERKQAKAVNLEAYKAQLDEMRRTFGTMLKQLPSKTEIPNLIVDISQTGLSSGLEIDLFQPQNEIKKGFYAEKPIKLGVQGTYQELGNFVSGISSLPRIVTLHNIKLTPTKNSDEIKMSALAKTYRYLEGN